MSKLFTPNCRCKWESSAPIKEESLKQLKKYEESNFIRNEFEGDDLKKVLFIVIGKKDIYTF